MPAPGSHDPFAALGLRRGRCDATDVRRAFRAMAREAHPDKGGDGARFHTLATAHDAALAELAATRRDPERYDWRDGRAAFDGGAATDGGAAFDARRADAPGETSGRASPTSPTSPTPPTRPPATSRPNVDASPPKIPTLETRARLRPPARASSTPPSRRAIVSLAVNARGFVAAAALDGGVVVWHVPSGRLVDAFQFEKAGKESDESDDAPRASDVWWVGRGGGGGGGGGELELERELERESDDVVLGDDALLAAAEDGSLALRRLESSGGDAHLRLFPRDGGRLVGHVARVTAACWTSTDGGRTTTLCTASLDATARTWRLGEDEDPPTPTDPSHSGSSSATPVATLRGHEAGLTCACVSGATLATCDARGEFRLWRLPNGEPTTTVRWGPEGDAILRCAFLPRRRASSRAPSRADDRDLEPLRLATAHYSREDDRGRVLVWRVGDGDEPVARVRGYEAEIPGRGRTFPGRPVDARVVLARRRTRRQHPACEDTSAEGTDSDSSDDSDSDDDADVLLACGSTGWVLGCDAASARTMYAFEEKCDRTVAGGFERATGGVRRCAPSPDGGTFATLRADGVVCVRRTSDGELVAMGECRREGGRDAVGAGGDAGGWSIAWSACGGYVIGGGEDGDAIVWTVPRENAERR